MPNWSNMLPTISHLAMLTLLLLGLPTSAQESEPHGHTSTNELPSVLLIGDSISLAYTPLVIDGLKEYANVTRVKGNCRFSAYGVDNVKEWVGDKRWNVIHFNFGLWDLYGWKQDGLISVEDYGKNLEAIVAELKPCCDVLIFGTTTPPCSEPEHKIKVLATSAKAAGFESEARRVMKQYGVLVNDLDGILVGRMQELGKASNDVHYTAEGTAVIADKVISFVDMSLGLLPKKADRRKIAVMETAFRKSGDATSFADAKAAGYTAIQMHSGMPAGFKKKPLDQSLSLPIGTDPLILKSWQAESAMHGVEIISLCAGSLNKCQIWGRDRELAMRIAKQTIDGCHTLGVNVMLFPFFGPSNFQTDDAAMEGVADFMKEILPYAQEKGVVIGIEAPITTVRVLELMERLKFPEHLKIYYDTGNLFAKEDIYETIAKYGQHFCEVHIKAAGSSVAGQGEIDLEKLADALNLANYDKWLVYEANRDGKEPEANRESIEKIVRLRSR